MRTKKDSKILINNMEKQITYREEMSLEELENYFDQCIKLIEMYNEEIANMQRQRKILSQNL